MVPDARALLEALPFAAVVLARKHAQEADPVVDTRLVPVQRYLLEYDVQDDDSRLMHVEHLYDAVRMAVAQGHDPLTVAAAAILRDAHHRLTWRLIYANGRREWRYGCAERVEAAQTLVGLDSIDGLDDRRLVQAWATRKHDFVEQSDMLEPSAIAVLAAASV